MAEGSVSSEVADKEKPESKKLSHADTETSIFLILKWTTPMDAIINPSCLSGNIVSPRSKSSMQRACAAALLRHGRTEIHLPGISNDDKAAMDVIRRLGASLKIDHNILHVSSDGVNPLSDVIDCGESGLGIRMFTPIAALSDKLLTITGAGSLVNRPMHFFDEIFPRIGISIQTKDGHLPLRIQGPLMPSDISVDGSLSSQFLTGLLMSFSAAEASDVSIHVHGLKSRPYIDLTLSVMRQFGMHLPEHRSGDVFYFPQPGLRDRQDLMSYTVEGDWSGASFLVVAGAIAGDIIIEGLDAQSVQGDKAILEALRSAGGEFFFSDSGHLHVHQSLMKAFSFDATECPDLFPPLVALAAMCSGTTHIQGVSRLAHKESDRGLTLQQEFAKLGVQIRLDGDHMYIEGGKPYHGAITHSRHDHRIAMALAVAGLCAKDSVTIQDAESVGKSYPHFFEDISSLGASVDLIGATDIGKTDRD